MSSAHKANAGFFRKVTGFTWNYESKHVVLHLACGHDGATKPVKSSEYFFRWPPKKAVCRFCQRKAKGRPDAS